MVLTLILIPMDHRVFTRIIWHRLRCSSRDPPPMLHMHRDPGRLHLYHHHHPQHAAFLRLLLDLCLEKKILWRIESLRLGG